MNTNIIYGHVERLSELLRLDSRTAGLEYGLQPVQLEVLRYLSVSNRFSDTPMAVTEYLGQTKGTVSQTLKVLEKKELLVKKNDEKDRRSTHLVLTEQGQKLLEEIIPSEVFLNACKDLTGSERKDITAALARLILSLLKANNMKTFGVCKTCRYNTRTNTGDYYCNLVKTALSDYEVELICREHQAPEGEV
ncbi:MarR family winged helix-turn-helix transcriptional regulator [Hahella ganghwensis]|uniref:MarR family winged helix-turn-helix transcriptional regulator n=1 Tax=Hahella ganghwensis TaxID=286420 RepID=UPI00037BC538|nr:MarR family winged helix-turn-helix transcriptional regulator [Hahella ganghwensis]